MANKRDQVRPWAGFAVPVLVVCWLVGYQAPWLPPGSGTAWLALSVWGAAHGLHGLDTSTRLATIAVTLCAVLGATLRVTSLPRQWPRLAVRQLGLFATCAPLCVVMPAGGAAFYLASLFVVASAVWISGSNLAGKGDQPLLQRLLGESFALLAALCFMTISWQYNAQWLMRGLLVAAGTALLARAVLPLQRSTGL